MCRILKGYIYIVMIMHKIKDFLKNNINILFSNNIRLLFSNDNRDETASAKSRNKFHVHRSKSYKRLMRGIMQVFS